MKVLLASLASVVVLAAPGFAATAVNRDAQAYTLIVTDGSERSELAIGPGETAEFCPKGCFVTMPNGDREALTGSESIEITDGVAHVR